MQITGQKAQLFARFYGRAGEYDTVDLSCAECRNRHCNGKVCLTCTRRTYTEGHCVFCDRTTIAFLSQRFRLNRLSAGGNTDTVAYELVDAVLITLIDKGHAIAHILFAESFSPVQQS